MRYWIFDQSDTPQRFPLDRLVNAVLEHVGDRSATVQVCRADGHGSRVCAWDSALDESAALDVPAGDLLRIATGTDEWFYNLDATCNATRFGVHDSTAMFVEAAPPVSRHIADAFRNVRRQLPQDKGDSSALDE